MGSSDRTPDPRSNSSGWGPPIERRILDRIPQDGVLRSDAGSFEVVFMCCNLDGWGRGGPDEFFRMGSSVALLGWSAVSDAEKKWKVAVLLL